MIKSVLLLQILIFTACTPKEYIYRYESEEDISGKVKEVPYNPNNFKVKCSLDADSIIEDKDKVVALSVHLALLGEHQFYPKNLKVELYVDGKKIMLNDTIHYNITTVTNDRVTYFKDTTTSLNIPDLISNLKKEKNLPDSLIYFDVISSYKRYYIGNTTNPPTIQIKVKTFWDGGEAVKEINYTLKQFEKPKKGEYKLPIRPYG